MIAHTNVAVLRVADAHVIEEIRAVLPLDDYVLGQLSETELVVDPRRLKELSELLESKGLAALVKRERPG
jgi:hypothetical protein